MRGLNVIKHKSLSDAVLFHQEEKSKAPKQQGKGAPVLFWYCKGNGQNGQHSGWRYIKADRTVAPGVLEYPEGHFVLRRMIDGKRIMRRSTATVTALPRSSAANENHKNGNVNAEGGTVRTLRRLDGLLQVIRRAGSLQDGRRRRKSFVRLRDRIPAHRSEPAHVHARRHSATLHRLHKRAARSA